MQLCHTAIRNIAVIDDLSAYFDFNIDTNPSVCYNYVHSKEGGGDFMADKTKKSKILNENGSFNRNAVAVINPLFRGNPYFDAEDIVQVKYEMLRAVSTGELSASEASRQFGFSRTAFYKIGKRFSEAGVEGLCHRKTGPKAPAKLTGDIMDFVSELESRRPGITNDGMVAEIRAQKGVSVHKRSLQRERSKKKR
jgi:transposase